MFVFAIVAAVIFVILLVAAIFTPRKTDYDVPARGIVLAIAAVVALLAILFTILSSFFSLDVGQAAVVRSWTGAIQSQSVDGQGLHGKAPWEDAITFDVRNQRVVFTNPQTSTGDNAGGTSDGREIAVIDIDGVDSNVDVTVRYNLDPSKVTDIYKQYKDEQNLKSTLIYNDIRSVVRSEAGKLHTLDLLTDRAKLQSAIREELNKRWAKQGVLIDEVALQQIDPPQSVKDAYASAQKSQIEVQKATNDLNATKVSAQQQVVQAQAQADANRILSESLTPQILEQKYLDALKQGTIYVVPAGSTPFIGTAR